MFQPERFFLTISLVCLCICTSVRADAKEKCRSLHHMDADSGTGYANNQCQLKCVIHGKTVVHNINEGFPCPLASSGTCKSGKCAQTSGPKVKVGHLDIEIVSATLTEPAKAYTTVCLKNSSAQVSLPIGNRAECVTCSSNVLQQATANPVWNSVCAGSDKFLFTSEARVAFEVWDHRGGHNNVFLGGVSLTVPQLLAKKLNHAELHLPLADGKANGQLSARVTWTAN